MTAAPSPRPRWEPGKLVREAQKLLAGVKRLTAERDEARAVATALVQFTNFNQTPKRLAELDELCKQVSAWGKVLP